MLREGRLISSDEILSRLGINPSEHEAVKAISKQLENLEAYGLVKSSPKEGGGRNDDLPVRSAGKKRLTF